MLLITACSSDSSISTVPEPTPAETLIPAGKVHSCALLPVNGTVKCWGDNELGQLGLGDTENRGGQANEMGDNLPAVDLGS